MISVLLMLGVAALVGIFIRNRIWGNANKPKTVLQHGRAWAAYIAFVVPMASINNFISHGFAEGLARFFVLIIFYPFIGFCLGCAYGMFKVNKKNEAEVSEKESQPHRHSSVIDLNNEVATYNPRVINEPKGVDFEGSDDWNLAIKYDDGLRNDYERLALIDGNLAKEFQKEIVFKKLVSNYKVLYEIYMKRAIGLPLGEVNFSKNELINEIVLDISKQYPLIAKEILELVKIYRFDEIDDYQVLASKLSPFLRKIEEVNNVEIPNRFTDMSFSNEMLIKYGLYKKYRDIDIDCLELTNGSVAIVRNTEYRIYKDKESAQFAIAMFKNMSNWTLKNLVEKIDR